MHRVSVLLALCAAAVAAHAWPGRSPEAVRAFRKDRRDLKVCRELRKLPKRDE